MPRHAFLISLCTLLAFADAGATADERGHDGEPPRQCEIYLSKLETRFDPHAIAEAKSIHTALSDQYDAFIDEHGESDEDTEADEWTGPKIFENVGNQLPRAALKYQGREIKTDREAHADPVTFGLNQANLLQGSRYQVMQRLQGVLRHLENTLDPLDENADLGEFALYFEGKGGLRNFSKNLAAGLIKVRDQSLPRATPLAMADNPLSKWFYQLVAEVAGAYYFTPESWGGLLHDFLKDNAGVDVPVNASYVAVGLIGAAKVYSGLQDLRSNGLTRPRAFMRWLLDSIHEPTPEQLFERRQAALAGVRPAYLQFSDYAKAVEEVANGQRKLKSGEFLYFGTPYALTRVESEKNQPADWQFDLVLYQDGATPKLLVFNRLLTE